METTDLTLKVLLEIRDEARATNARLDVNTARLDNHERILLRVADELGHIHGTLERIDGRVVRLEAGQELTNERLERLELGQERTNERLERLEVGQQLTNDRLRTLVGLTGAVTDRQSEDGAAIEDLRRRVGLLERKLG
ncbi:MAG: hypothetical protein IAG13_21590 [Deltaproteobacteria bacterium]|nr:hypothetical protein [Nannocystaceae bacterium]